MDISLLISYIQDDLWAYCRHHEWDIYVYATEELANKASTGIFPFATIITHDTEYDNISALDRPKIYRLNIGVSKEIYIDLFWENPKKPKPDIWAYKESGYDFTVLDNIMPHPIYWGLYWICVLTPSDVTFVTLKQYLLWAFEKQKAMYQVKK